MHCAGLRGMRRPLPKRPKRVSHSDVSPGVLQHCLSIPFPLLPSHSSFKLQYLGLVLTHHVSHKKPPPPPRLHYRPPPTSTPPPPTPNLVLEGEGTVVEEGGYSKKKPKLLITVNLENTREKFSPRKLPLTSSLLPSAYF